MESEGFRHLPAYFDRQAQSRLLAHVRAVLTDAPLYTPTMPRSGRPLSVSMSNCGRVGWVTDKAGGYRYQPHHPTTGRPWPAIPDMLMELWSQVAPAAPAPEACLINYYKADAKLGSHVDSDEPDQVSPVVSVSLGDEAIFHVGGLRRSDPKARHVLKSGDVAVLGGPSRRAYHGVDRIVPGSSGLLVEGGRFNLTLRRVTLEQVAACLRTSQVIGP